MVALMMILKWLLRIITLLAVVTVIFTVLGCFCALVACMMHKTE